MPGPPPAAVAEATCSARQALVAAAGLPPDTGWLASPGDLVLDVVLDTPERWWVGWHRAESPAGCWPGGIYPPAGAELPVGKVSRAWLKLD